MARVQSGSVQKLKKKNATVAVEIDKAININQISMV
jgi:hypothetical protein